MLRVVVVAAVLALLATLPPSAAAQTVRTIESMAVYDSLGRRVGDVNWNVPHFEQVEVVFRLESGGPVVVALTGDGWVSDVVGFESGDCTGQAFVPGGPLGIVTGPRATLYVRAGRPSETATIASVLAGDACIPPGPGWNGPHTRTYPRLDFADYFVPPFRVRARGDVVTE